MSSSKDFFKTNGIALAALCVAIISAKMNCNGIKNVATQQSIDNIYKTFNDMATSNITNWDISHLNAMPANYDSCRAAVHLATAPLTTQKRAEYFLKERTFAINIFTVYEQMHYQFEQAKSARNKKKKTISPSSVGLFYRKIVA